MKLMPASRALATIRVDVASSGAAEHHGAQTDRRDFQAAAAELTVLHLVKVLSEAVIPGSMVSHRPGMTETGLPLRFALPNDQKR